MPHAVHADKVVSNGVSALERIRAASTRLDPINQSVLEKNSFTETQIIDVQFAKIALHQLIKNGTSQADAATFVLFRDALKAVATARHAGNQDVCDTIRDAFEDVVKNLSLSTIQAKSRT
jgi:hypothetical protein